MRSVRRAAFLLALLLAVGCGGGGDKPIAVTGKVTFKGEPVTEGTVQFVDDATGRGAEVELKPDGGYETSLPAGQYKVLVSPPYLVDNTSGIPNPKYKKVKNIPDKFQSTATSGLSAAVSADKSRHDFTLGQ